ncbi:glycosyltransferase family 39 protein [Hymenobacter profundi]|uniref:Glycosyltransferase family 39 protein n=1 Tax=Hymenobacter profundi TaxID=1982110 RepID=A0ABS6WVX2_9BACT|nr:glycosyltransferase family 39 protein [Hymenobacter profundi]MBW3127747.1 glycosyltransferase family 39 protein [Hymenobacter profundi]
MQVNIRNRFINILQIGLFFILLVGFLLRFLQLENYPLSAHHDELSNIYDGYSIAETGADRWGQKYPLILRGFGTLDYRPPMYAWLSAITISLFGFSVASGRLVSVILGCFSLIILYLVAKKMGGKLFAFFALLLIVLSPWHILFSRIASEGTLLPSFFLISTCYLWQRVKEKDYNIKSLLLLGVCIGLGTSTYQSSKLIFFLFTLLVFYDLFRHANKALEKGVAFAISCLVGASPQIIAALTMPKQFFSRAEGSMMKFSFSFDYINSIFKNILSNISPNFLFFEFGNYNYFTVDRLLMLEFVFFYIGLFFIYKIIDKKQVISPMYFYSILIIAIIPSALTQENPNALRASCLIVLAPLITAAGIVFIYNYINTPVLKSAYLIFLTTLITLNSYYFINKYISSEELRNVGMRHTFVEACKKVNIYQNKYNKIFIQEDNGDGQDYIFVATYCSIKPEYFQISDKEINKYGWDNFKKLGKFYFLSASEIDNKLNSESSRVLMVLGARNNKYKIIDSVEVANEKMFLYENSLKAL